MALISMALLCGCPGEPVEGSGSADGGSTSSDDSATVTASNTMTMGSQSVGDSSDGSNSNSISATDTSGDPTSSTLTETGTATTTADTGTETSAATDTTMGGETTTVSSGTTTDGSSTDSGACVDPQEPNETEATAIGVGSVSCNGDPLVVDLIADDATTPDWFSYAANHDELACGEDGLPRVRITNGPSMQVCAYVDCGVNVPTAVCDAGNAANSPGGFPGCCALDEVRLIVDCSNGGNESSTVHISVDTAGQACAAYTLELES